MSFYSIGFAIFIATLWLAARRASPPARQWIFLAASYYFYWTWSHWFVLLLVLLSLFDFAWGKLLVRRRAAGWLWAGIAINFSVLVAYKASIALLGTGRHSWMAQADLLVPVGISFFTFQGISYLVDIYRGYAGSAHPRPFFLYMAFWPTILSGPICRAPEMLPQFEKTGPSRGADILPGLQRIILGLFLKLVLAQSLQDFWDPPANNFNLMDLFLVAFGLGIWLYLDFAGYSHIACGAAQILGIQLRENFDFPYHSITPQEFWTRWHMSLSSWIRDYIFFPLSTLRTSLAWRYWCLLLSMALFGLWHMPALNFILWGAYHGALLGLWRKIGPAKSTLMARTSRALLIRAFSGACTLGLVSLGWLIFWTQVDDWGPLLNGLNPSGEMVLPPDLYLLVLLLWVGHLGLGWLLSGRDQWQEDSWQAWVERSLRLPISVVMLIMLIALASEDSPFAYVNF